MREKNDGTISGGAFGASRSSSAAKVPLSNDKIVRQPTNETTSINLHTEITRCFAFRADGGDGVITPYLPSKSWRVTPCTSSRVYCYWLPLPLQVLLPLHEKYIRLCVASDATYGKCTPRRRTVAWFYRRKDGARAEGNDVRLVCFLDHEILAYYTPRNYDRRNLKFHFPLSSSA